MHHIPLLIFCNKLFYQSHTWEWEPPAGCMGLLCSCSCPFLREEHEWERLAGPLQHRTGRSFAHQAGADSLTATRWWGAAAVSHRSEPCAATLPVRAHLLEVTSSWREIEARAAGSAVACEWLDWECGGGLSKMQLETKDIDSHLFSQMLNLELLDISQNNLSDLPGKLSLPKLKVLTFSDNQVEDVTILQQFPSLEEVMYEENLYLTVSDNYKVFCLLPKLRRLNNKDITSLANHVRFVNHRELSSRVESYWEKNYKDKMPDDPTPANIKSISKDFLKSVGNHVKYGPSSLKDFTKWKVQIIADHLISSLLGEEKRLRQPPCEEASTDSDSEENAPVTPSKRQTQDTESDPEVRSPSKRLRSHAEDNCIARTPSKRLRSAAETDVQVASPTKRLRSSEVLTIVLSPKRSSKFHESPLKSTSVTGKLSSTPVKGQATRGLLTPTKVSLRSAPSKQTVGQTVSSGKAKSKKRPINLEPLHFLQSHSKNNENDDFRTQLWSCAFEPNLDSSSSSKVIATCGGGSVCVIDCETGKVLRKYKVPGEEFFALAWSTLTMICKEGQKRKINVLAAGGKFGVVKLMEPKVGLCYGEIKAHKKAISVMCFSPTQDTFLFTGSYDKRIILWDVGVPDHEYNFRSSQLLTLDTTSTPLCLTPVPASPDQHLMAACEDGCFVWDITLKKQQGKRSHEVEFNFPIYNKESKDSDFHIVDGLSFLSDDLIVSKSAMQGSMYIWSWKKSFQRPKSKNSRKAEAHILAELKWSETDLPYLAPTTSIDGHCVLCGDEAGKIWIYDLESCKAELEKGVPSKALKEPTKIIDWPYPVARKEKVGESVINTVLVDPGMEYLVALTDKNIIAIWKIL